MNKKCVIFLMTFNNVFMMGHQGIPIHQIIKILVHCTLTTCVYVTLYGKTRNFAKHARTLKQKNYKILHAERARNFLRDFISIVKEQ